MYLCDVNYSLSDMLQEECVFCFILETLFYMKKNAYYLLMFFVGILTMSCEKKEPRWEPAPQPQTVAVTGVSLNKTTLALETGSSETLTAAIVPQNATNQAVSWSSSNSDAATVDNAGKVTAVAAGVATVTVTTADGGKTAQCNVTVSSKAVTGVSLNKTTLNLITGDSETLTATVSPDDATNKNVTWSSSNEAVVTVDNEGTVTAVSKGSATVTVISVDGGKTATCEVTVEPKYFAAFKFDGTDYRIADDKTCIFTYHSESYYVINCSDEETKQALNISISEKLERGGSYDIYSGSPYIMSAIKLLFTAGETIAEESFWTDDFSQAGIVGKLTITELTDDLLAGTFTCRTMNGEITEGTFYVKAREWE